MNTYDIVVIGGGPAGSMAALTAAGLGLDVLLVERDRTIGYPVRCAEGVDEKGLSEFFTPDPSWIAANITGYNLIAPDGTVVTMDTGNVRGFILERVKFDRMVAERAAEAGASVKTGVEAFAMSDYDHGFRTVSMRTCSTSEEWTVKARIVIAADGTESRAARWAGLKTNAAPHDMETCAQVTLAGVDIDPHSFSLYFTQKYAPSGYAWMFPKGSRTANVGLGISGDCAGSKKPVEFLDDFLAAFFPDASVVSRTVGGISCTGGLKKIVTDGVMVCGDAAHMANPITGGGIINALIAGKYAGETAADVLLKRNVQPEEHALAVYQKRCENRFGSMNRRFYRIKEAILTIPDNRFNEIAHEIIKLPVSKRTPVRVLTSALTSNPAMLLVLAKVVF
ncbi:NAD(P)/FAD-dependent oxidoreductase [bacterium]|nr:NAD(P)/FAD-dependent oxidoreductase [bacterium]